MHVNDGKLEARVMKCIFQGYAPRVKGIKCGIHEKKNEKKRRSSFFPSSSRRRSFPAPSCRRSCPAPYCRRSSASLLLPAAVKPLNLNSILNTLVRFEVVLYGSLLLYKDFSIEVVWISVAEIAEVVLYGSVVAIVDPSHRKGRKTGINQNRNLRFKLKFEKTGMTADVKDLPVGVRLLGVHEIGGCCSPLPLQQGKSRGRGGWCVASDRWVSQGTLVRWF
ncbi:hypothetical protein LXL04_038318 [Taraxacum kok-saghyz]